MKKNLLVLVTGLVALSAQANMKCTFSEIGKAQGAENYDSDQTTFTVMDSAPDPTGGNSKINPAVAYWASVDKNGNINITIYNKDSGVSAENSVGPATGIESKGAFLHIANSEPSAKIPADYSLKCSL
jgi:hypothetical protein